MGLPVQAEKLKFNRDIRPILSEKCFHCHGPDVAGNKADLRLDVREIAIEYLQSGEVVERITHSDPDERMPPPDSNRLLTAKQKATIKQWIEEGAEYEAHWAYETPEKPEVPKGVHPVDHFINAELAQKKVEASSAADRRTLARRLHLDLLGLPPKSADVEAFVGNPDGKAWQTYVEQTLKSPHFGERIAVYWLDLVRYADTVGFHGDQNMAVAPYRDYVIRSFNNNLPFDQFTREQIAGDLLPEPTMWQQVATAYNRLNKKTNEGGAQDLEYRVKNAADRVRATSTVWMGATLGCAECHDHKFDPFSQKDFYQFAAFFADIEENGFYGRNGHKDGIWGSYLKVPREGDEAKIAALDKQIGGYKKEIAGRPEGVDAGVKEMVANLKKQIEGTSSMWTVAELTDLKSTGGATMKKQSDGSWLATGKNPDKDDYTFTLKPTKEGISGFLIESLVDKSMSKGANSRGNGNIVVSYIEVKDAKGDVVKIIEAKADFEQNGWPVKGALNAAGSGWAIDGHNHKKSRQAYFKFDRRMDKPFTVSIQHRSEHARHVIGRLRVSTTGNAEIGLTGAQLPKDLVAAVTAEKPNKAQSDMLEKRYRDTSPLFTEARKKLLEAEKTKKSMVDGQATVLITKKAAKPREVRVLNRGNWMDKTGELVGPGTPHFMKAPAVAEGTELTRQLAGLEGQSADRAGVRQPFVETDVRHRFEQGARRCRFAGRAADPSGAARLARSRVHGQRLGCETHGRAAGHLRDLSAQQHCASGLGRNRSLQPLAGAPVAVPRAGRVRPRQRALGQRSAQHADRRRNSEAIPDDEGLRRARPRGVHRQARHQQHADPVAGAAERPKLRRGRARPRRTHRQRRRHRHGGAYGLGVPRSAGASGAGEGSPTSDRAVRQGTQTLPGER